MELSLPGLTQPTKGFCKTNFRVSNSVTTPGCMHWNNERLLAFVNSDLKCHRHVVEVGVVYWYHINCDPRIPLIHRHSEKKGVVVWGIHMGGVVVWSVYRAKEVSLAVLSKTGLDVIVGLDVVGFRVISWSSIVYDVVTKEEFKICFHWFLSCKSYLPSHHLHYNNTI